MTSKVASSAFGFIFLQNCLIVTLKWFNSTHTKNRTKVRKHNLQYYISCYDIHSLDDSFGFRPHFIRSCYDSYYPMVLIPPLSSDHNVPQIRCLCFYTSGAFTTDSPTPTPTGNLNEHPILFSLDRYWSNPNYHRVKSLVMN
jgi:hypothetical protein